MQFTVKEYKYIYREGTSEDALIAMKKYSDSVLIFDVISLGKGGEIQFSDSHFKVERQGKEDVSVAFNESGVDFAKDGAQYSIRKTEDGLAWFQNEKCICRLPILRSDDLTINAQCSCEHILLLLLISLALFHIQKSSFFSKQTLFDLMQASSETYEELTRPPLKEAVKLFSEQKKVGDLACFGFPRFPWLADTLQYCRRENLPCKTSMMNHLILLLTQTEVADTPAYEFAWEAYQAAFGPYSLHEPYDYSPVAKALKKLPELEEIKLLSEILTLHPNKTTASTILSPCLEHSDNEIYNYVSGLIQEFIPTELDEVLQNASEKHLPHPDIDSFPDLIAQLEILFQMHGPSWMSTLYGGLFLKTACKIVVTLPQGKFRSLLFSMMDQVYTLDFTPELHLLTQYIDQSPEDVDFIRRAIPLLMADEEFECYRWLSRFADETSEEAIGLKVNQWLNQEETTFKYADVLCERLFYEAYAENSIEELIRLSKVEQPLPEKTFRVIMMGLAVAINSTHKDMHFRSRLFNLMGTFVQLAPSAANNAIRELIEKEESRVENRDFVFETLKLIRFAKLSQFAPWVLTKTKHTEKRIKTLANEILIILREHGF
ncbi:MAG: hypothetical protein AAFO69_10640 [Bacteroidota bacterium]